jgi:fatty acid desaturase
VPGTRRGAGRGGIAGVSPGARETGSRDLAGAARAALGCELGRLVRARPGIYGLDLLASAALGWGASAWAARRGGADLAWLCATLVAIAAQLRALVFVHEIAHRRATPLFEAIWNLCVGVPLCVPSSMYVGSHPEHHRADRFATTSDPEYAPIARWGPERRALFVLAGALVPVLLVLRWGVLGPLCLGPLPRLRPWVIAKCSTLSINPAYARDVRAYRAARRSLALEWGCALFVWSSIAALLVGALPLAAAAQWMVVAGGVFATNQLRTLAAHGYASFGRRDRDGQFLDSINLAASPLTLLIAPLGLRYHALHHLLPELPYHSLGRAHRLLADRLGADPRYRRSQPQGLARVIYLARSRSTSSKSVVASSPSGTADAPISAARSTCSKQ